MGALRQTHLQLSALARTSWPKSSRRSTPERLEMPRVKPGHRKRKFGPKRRSGCPTCKIRHVRCDETKPACQNCTSTGRTCDDGYATGNSNGSKTPSNTAALVKPVERGLALYVETSPRETRAFLFYLHRTAPQLSGFEDACLFWEQIVPQIAFTDGGVRHALIALASCHENFQDRDNVENAQFTLRQYNAAIARYVNSNDGSDPGSSRRHYLLSCVIFICIEIIRGHYISALVLLRQGLKMISDQSVLRGPPPTSGPCPRTFEACKSILLRLEIQAIALLGEDAWGPEHPLHLHGHQPSIPQAFSSVAQSRDSFADNRLMFYLHGLGRKTAHSPSKYAPVLQRWSAAFDAFLAKHEDNLTDREKCAVHVLKIQRLLLAGFVNIGANRSDVKDQTTWDRSFSTFEEIVSLAEAMLLETSGKVPSDCEPLFTLDIGFVGSLYDVARRCRDPSIRRRAIHLLRSSARQEGLWDGQLAARAAERVVEVEENGLGRVVTSSSDIPDQARISAVLPVFDPENRVARARFSSIDRFQTQKASAQETMSF